MNKWKKIISCCTILSLILGNSYSLNIYANEEDDIEEEQIVNEEQIVEEDPIIDEEEISEEVEDEEIIEEDIQNHEIQYLDEYSFEVKLDMSSSDELYNGFVEKLFEMDEIQEEAYYASPALSQYPQLVELKRDYEALINDVAYGRRTSTISESSLVFSYEEVGLEKNSDISAVQQKVIELSDLISSEIVRPAYFEHPFEFYWTDKFTGVSMNFGYDGENLYLVNLKFSIAANLSYRLGDDRYTVDSNKVYRAIRASENAKSCVYYANNTFTDDIAKMNYFKTAILELVDYDYLQQQTHYAERGDPQQLVSVFDGDPETLVVCEGYARAFKYLCDLANIPCLLVNGDMGGESHAWNVVPINGKNYIVDVTNCESDPYRIFLKGAKGSVEDGYYENGTLVKYEYDSNTLAMFDRSQLEISSSNYLNYSEKFPSPKYNSPVFSPSKYPSPAPYSQYSFLFNGNTQILPGETVDLKAVLINFADSGNNVVQATNISWDIQQKSGWTVNVDTSDPSIVHITAPKSISDSMDYVNMTVFGYYNGQRYSQSTGVLCYKDYYDFALLDKDGNEVDELNLYKYESIELEPVVYHRYVKNGKNISDRINLTDIVFYTNETCEIKMGNKNIVDNVSQSNPQTFTLRNTKMSGFEYLSMQVAFLQDNGYKSYLSKTVNVKSKSSMIAKLEGYSMTLSDEIAVNFFMSMDSSIQYDKKAKAVVTYPDGSQIEENLSSLYNSPIQKYGDTYYKITCFVSAKDLTSKIHIEFINGDNEVMYRNDFTVEEYANYLFDHNPNYINYTPLEEQLVHALLTYGFYSQLYFGYNTNHLPQRINGFSNVDLSKYAYSLKDTSDKVEFVGARLVLGSKFGLKLYFITDQVLKMNGQNAQTTKEGKYTVITLSNISTISTMNKIQCDNFELNYGILSYCDQALHTNNVKLQQLAKAIYMYGQYVEYKNTGNII